jgi:hypothetical protein
MSPDPEIPNMTVGKITETTLCGFWEVFRISRGNCSQPIYPWLGKRFKYYFLDEMMYICCRDGHICHGTWGLTEKPDKGRKGLYLILDDKVAYEIKNVFSDEMKLSDGKCEYYLIRKL